MQRACFALLFLVFALPSLSACDGGGGCVIDSDCPSFQQVCIEQRCVDPGTTPDAGRSDAGPRPDGGGADDAGQDAEMPMPDAGGDAGNADDGGVPICPDPTGSWVMTVITPEPCGNPTSGYAATISSSGSCNFAAATSVVGQPSVDGTFSLAADGTLTGTLDIGGTGAASSCTGSVSSDGATLSIICNGTCVVSLSRS